MYGTFSWDTTLENIWWMGSEIYSFKKPRLHVCDHNGLRSNIRQRLGDFQTSITQLRIVLYNWKSLSDRGCVTSCQHLIGVLCFAVSGPLWRSGLIWRSGLVWSRLMWRPRALLRTGLIWRSDKRSGVILVIERPGPKWGLGLEWRSEKRSRLIWRYANKKLSIWEYNAYPWWATIGQHGANNISFS